MSTHLNRLTTKHPLLQDPRVSRGLGFSLDRKQLVDKVNHFCHISAFSFTPLSSLGYEPDTSIKFDPEYART